MIKQTILAVSLLLAGGSAIAQHQSVEYWPNGKKQSEGTYSADPGLLTTDSKEITAEKLGKVSKTGNWSYWYENGSPLAEEHYTAGGTPTGVWKSWHANGQLSAEINFSAGTATYWFEDGKKSSQGSVSTSLAQTGHWILWHSNGQKNAEGNYNSSGQQTGTWTFWSPEGKKTAEQTWNNGTLVDTKRFE